MATLEFFGAVGEVTGSCYLLHTNAGRILLECGLYQGGDAEHQRNSDSFPFPVESIDAVVLSHAHIDHSGRLPLLVKRGYRNSIFMHEATAELCAIMLQDSAYIHEKEAEWENRRRKRDHRTLVEPVYTREDASAVQECVHPLSYHEPIEILPGVELYLYDAGHILGSSIVQLKIREAGTQRTLVFSGDLGHRGAPILRDPEPVGAADLVVMESTYGDRMHRSWADTWAELGEVLSNARAGKGNILIPAFAVGRTQELLYAFHRNRDAWGIDDWQIFLDSPMAIRTTKVYQNNASVYDRQARSVKRETGSLFDLDNLYLSETTEQSMGINQIASGAIVIAGSGMCTGGRIRHHLRHHISRAQSHVVIVGFQAAGTTGRALVDGARHIRLMGRSYDVRARIHTVGGLSAHADQEGLFDWYASFDGAPQVALVHGEPAAADALHGRLQSELNASVFRPQHGSRIDF
jgi:metallo-beta-lactamase family protein